MYIICMELLDHTVVLCLIFWGTAKLVSKVAELFYISTNNTWNWSLSGFFFNITLWILHVNKHQVLCLEQVTCRRTAGDGFLIRNHKKELKNICITKETITKTTKRRPSEWEKIFSNKATNKGLISKIYKPIMQLNWKNKQPNQKKHKQTGQMT